MFEHLHKNYILQCVKRTLEFSLVENNIFMMTTTQLALTHVKNICGVKKTCSLLDSFLKYSLPT